MELPPAASPSAPMFRRGPLTFADDGQSGAVNDEVQAGARAAAPKREGEMLTASRERGVIGCREIDAQHPEDRGQDALGLTQRSVEEETERQGGFDGEIGLLELPAPPADASRCPRGDRGRREPEGDVASPHEGSVVLGPVPDAIRCLVLRMHSRLHIEIMTRRRSRWSTCRPLLAHRAESAHQRPEFALRTCALGRHSWLPTHRRPVAAAHFPSLCGPPERMWTDAACPRPPPRRDPAHDPAQARLDHHAR